MPSPSVFISFSLSLPPSLHPSPLQPFMHAQLHNVVRHTIVNVACLSKATSTRLNQKITSTLSGTHAHYSAFLSI